MKKRLFAFVLSMVMMLASINLVHAAAFEGEGTADSPYLIKTFNALWLIPADTTAHYKITDDLDGTGYTKAPLPTFKGTLDGDGHVIRNLTIGNGNSHAGLFSTTAKATIKNLSIENINLSNNTTNSTGGFVGYSTDSSFINCHIISGVITASLNVGGMVGLGINTTILYCSVNVNINATIDNVAGLIGYTTTNNKISQSFTSGVYKGRDRIAGAVGSAVGSSLVIDNFYSNATLQGGIHKAGIVQSGTDVYPPITNSYFAGKIINGGVPLSSSGQIYASFYDQEVTGILGYPQATTTADMKKQATYAGWDFEKIWTIEEGVSYPTLRALSQSSPSEPTNTQKLSILLKVSETVQLLAKDTLAENAGFTWTSSNTDTVGVDTNGKITAIKKGTAIITCENTTLGYKQSVNVVVAGEEEPILDQRLSVMLPIGEIVNLILNENNGVTYTSMDEAIATVTSDGKVTGVSNGLVLIKAEYDNVSEVIYVRVVSE